MTDTRHESTTEPRLEAPGGHNGDFLKSLVDGALIGAAVGVIFAPRAYAALRTLRRQLTDASDAAATSYRATTTRVGDAVDDLQQEGREVYGKALSVVVRGAEDVGERATEAQAELDQSAAPAARRSS